MVEYTREEDDAIKQLYDQYILEGRPNIWKKILHKMTEMNKNNGLSLRHSSYTIPQIRNRFCRITKTDRRCQKAKTDRVKKCRRCGAPYRGHSCQLVSDYSGKSVYSFQSLQPFKVLAQDVDTSEDIFNEDVESISTEKDDLTTDFIESEDDFEKPSHTDTIEEVDQIYRFEIPAIDEVTLEDTLNSELTRPSYDICSFVNEKIGDDFVENFSDVV